MIRLRQMPWWLAVVFAIGPAAAFPLAAETTARLPVPNQLLSAPTNFVLPQAKSPVDLFRDLLAMTPIERRAYLTNRPPAVRERILAKLHEYTALNPDERELRLRATELRWYLLPLLHDPPTNRVAQLAAIPNDLRGLVDTRLTQWDVLPPPLQEEFFESERALRYFTHVDASNSLPPDAAQLHGSPGADLAHWNSLSEDQRQKTMAQFNQFFELTPGEKQRALNTLSAAERQQMEKTLAAFEQLPRTQRLECIRAFTEFAGMSAGEKQEFLKNAERWAQMSPKERQTWRDLVTHVPEWPPLPTTPSESSMPAPPPSLTLHARPVLATNHN